MDGFGRARMAAVLLGIAIAETTGAAANAATVGMDAGAVVFTATVGEANDLRADLYYGVQVSGDALPTAIAKLTDRGAPLRAVGSSCTQIDEQSVVCTEVTQSPSLVVQAGDGDDRVWAEDYVGWPAATIRGGTGQDWLRAGSHVGFSPVLEGDSGNDSLIVNNNGGGWPILRGGDGNDKLSIPESGGGYMHGNDGADELEYGGYGSPTEMHGDGGDDHLIVTDFASGYPPSLDGGDHDDRYTFSAASRFSPETIVPGPGIDTLDQGNGTFAIDFSMAACPGCVETVIGSPLDDHVTGDNGAQSFLGGDGADTLDAGGGRDVVAGQDGDDTIMSRDRVVDDVSCGSGIDWVVADGFDRPGQDCETVDRRAAGHG